MTGAVRSNPTRASASPACDGRRREALPRVAGYELIGLLGRGGMATVYLARQLKLDRLVALKELSPPFAGDPEFADRFLRESRFAGGLAHPNVVTVFDYFEAGGLPYIAMEHVARGSLRPFMRHRSVAQLAGVLDGVLAGLAHAHAAGVVHCDLKPENVLVTAEGDVKLGDFGVARAADVAAATSDAAGRATGTPAYMAPEVLAREPFDHLADLWSVGVIAYELLAGCLPDPSRPRLGGGLSAHDPRLARWIEELLEPSPDRRPPSAEAARERLEEIALANLGARWRRQARLALDGAPPGRAVTRPPLRPRLPRLLVASMAVVVVLAAVAIAPSPRSPAPAARADIHDPPAPPAVAASVEFSGPRTVKVRSTSGSTRVQFAIRARRLGRSLRVRCRPRSGSIFEIGSTRVTCAAYASGRRLDARHALRVFVRPPAHQLPGHQPPVRTAPESGAGAAPRPVPSTPDPGSHGFSSS